ncbi:MAG: hypothetical protein ACFFBP_06030 [Promethearchaeota archaeon]
MGEIHLDYESLVNEMMTYAPDIYAMAIFENLNEIVFSTDNWDISADIKKICLSWNSLKIPFMIISGIKYTVLECEIDSIVATSLQGEGHIVGVKDEEIHILSYVRPDGDIKSAIVELSRFLPQINPKEPYMDPDIEFKTSYIDPKLISEIKEFLEWINDPEGLQGFITYYFQNNDIEMISELSKIYCQLLKICQESY